MLNRCLASQLARRTISFVGSRDRNPFFLRLSRRTMRAILRTPSSLVGGCHGGAPNGCRGGPVCTTVVRGLSSDINEVYRIVGALKVTSHAVIVFCSSGKNSRPIASGCPLGKKGKVPCRNKDHIPLVVE